MRTKTLLIAAAALAAVVTSSHAQSTVYSQNVVGYVNIPVTNRVYAMIANQLDTGSNTVNNVLQSGLASSATSLLIWNGAGYNEYFYYNNGDSPSGNAGWFDGFNNPWGSTNYLQPGEGAFIFNSSGANITVPTVGQVVQGTNQYTVPAGYSIWALPESLAGLPLDNTNINFPAVSSSDTYLQWSGTGYNVLFYYNNGDSPNGGHGWFTGFNVLEDTNSAYWPNAGQSFFIHHLGAPETWTNVFQVQ